MRELFGTLDVVALARSAEGRDHGLAGVHVGVLSPVAGQLPIGAGFVGIQACGGLPEMLFSGIKGLSQPHTGFGHSGFVSAGVGQHHKGHAVAVARGVLHGGAAFIPVDQPGVAARGGVEERGAQKLQRMPHAHLVTRLARGAVEHGVRDHKTGGADEVAGVRVVDRAIVQKEVELPAARVGGHGGVERHGVLQMLAQEGGGSEVWQGRGHGGSLLSRSG